MATHSREPSPALRAAAVVLGLAIALAVFAIAFALPAAKSKPHDVPVGAAGPQAAEVAGLLDHNAPGGFRVTAYADEGALRTAIRGREVYGGFSSGPNGPLLVIATGASPTIAQLLTQIGNGMAQHTGVPLHTEDLAPPTADDPRGAGLAASALPITLGGLLPAIALVLVLPREIWTRFAATAAFGGIAGWTVAVLLRFVFGSIDQNFWGVTGGVTLGVLGASLSMLGLGSLFGRIGLGVGAALAMLLGNPLSGLTSAPELLPSGWGALGQLLPQGANATLLRSTAYFAGANATKPVVVLTCWAIAGVVLIVIAALRQRRATRERWVPVGSPSAFVTAPVPSRPAPVASFRPRWADPARA